MSHENPYSSVSEQQYYKVKMKEGRIHQNDVEWHSVSDVEKQMVRDTSFLICALDNTLDEELWSKNYLEEHRQYDQPCTAAIYLDKSARPVRALVSEFWTAFSDEKEPAASFLNIDKIDYLLNMGYSMQEIQSRYIGPEELSLDKIDPRLLKTRLAEIRSMYITDRDLLPKIEQMIKEVEKGEADPTTLDEIWDIPTALDGQHVAIVDEVRSSGATLTIANQLISRALPEVHFEPLFWMTNSSFIFEDEAGAKHVADTGRPPWYNSRTSSGRVIDNVNPERASKSENIYTRIGKYILSRPYAEGTDVIDTLGIGYRNDFKLMRERYDEGKIAKPADARRLNMKAS